MNTKEHNNLIAKCYEGNPHLKHVLTVEDINKMSMIEGRFPLTRLPVCSHCEKLGMWSHDANNEAVGICLACGSITRRPMTYSEYLAKGYDVDKTGENFRKMAQTDKDFRENTKLILPNYKMRG